MTATIVEHHDRRPRDMSLQTVLTFHADADVTAQVRSVGLGADGQLWQRFGSPQGPSRPRWIACVGRRIQHISVGSITWTSKSGHGGIAWDARDRRGQRNWVPFRGLR